MIATCMAAASGHSVTSCCFVQVVTGQMMVLIAHMIMRMQETGLPCRFSCDIKTTLNAYFASVQLEETTCFLSCKVRYLQHWSSGREPSHQMTNGTLHPAILVFEVFLVCSLVNLSLLSRSCLTDVAIHGSDNENSECKCLCRTYGSKLMDK